MDGFERLEEERFAEEEEDFFGGPIELFELVLRLEGPLEVPKALPGTGALFDPVEPLEPGFDERSVVPGGVEEEDDTEEGGEIYAALEALLIRDVNDAV